MHVFICKVKALYMYVMNIFALLYMNIIIYFYDVFVCGYNKLFSHSPFRLSIDN